MLSIHDRLDFSSLFITSLSYILVLGTSIIKQTPIPSSFRIVVIAIVTVSLLHRITSQSHSLYYRVRHPPSAPSSRNPDTPNPEPGLSKLRPSLRQPAQIRPCDTNELRGQSRELDICLVIRVPGAFFLHYKLRSAQKFALRQCSRRKPLQRFCTDRGSTSTSPPLHLLSPPQRPKCPPPKMRSGLTRRRTHLKSYGSSGLSSSRQAHTFHWDTKKLPINGYVV